MTILITGNFQQHSEARQVLADLEGSGFSVDQTTSFLVHPAGRSALDPALVVPARAGGEAAGTAPEPDQPAVRAIAVAGAATLPLPGAGDARAASAIGAHAGAGYSSLSKLADRDGPQAEVMPDHRAARGLARQPGMLVAVLANEPAEQDVAIRILRKHGATDIERLEGVISAGTWTGFNPSLQLNLLADALPFRP